MNTVILDTAPLKYRVTRGKETLNEAFSFPAAERFIESLPEDQREGITITPITSTGEQVLFG